MKKQYTLILSCTLLILGTSTCDQANSSSTKTVVNTSNNEDELALAPKPLETMPYTISVTEASKQPAGAVGIQSSAHTYNGQWLMMLGGRIQGFHGTANAGGVFSSKYANTNISILNPVSGEYLSMPLPTEYRDFLSSTNMEYYYDGKYMICAGGYGSIEKNGNEKFQTFPRLTAIDFNSAVEAIKTQDATKLKASMLSIKDERFRVTGGGIEKIGENYYLAFGQDYDTIYIPGITGKYTEEIKRFRLAIDAESITVSQMKIFKDPTGATGTASEYHRRDLNVVPVTRPDGSEGINILGGVFTADGGGWVHPISIYESNSETNIELDTNFSQKLSQYECAEIEMYDFDTKTSYTTLLGGISFYYYKNGKLVPSTHDDVWLPFTSSITTIVQTEAGFQEFPQAEAQSLPKLLGSDAIFMVNSANAFVGNSKDLIDHSKLKSGKTLLGWMYGGILATEPTSSEMNPTFANKVLYEVWIEK